MPLNFNLNLPGPFSYNKRVSGGSSIKKYVRAHTEAARANEQDLPPESYPRQRHADWWAIVLIIAAVLFLFIGSYLGLLID